MTDRHRTDIARRARCQGFTLLEALITVVVLGIGLLGIAGLQFVSLHFSDSAHQQSMATMLAADLAERMRANPLGVEAGDYDKPDEFDSPSDEPSEDCMSAECTPAQLASRDIWEWKQAVQSRFPSSAAVVCLDNKPDELSDTDTHNEERSTNAFDADCTPQNAFCDNNGSIYAIKIWWCEREVEGAEEGANAIRYFVQTLVP
jgi:type IV pilus assembly protein PilV